MNFEMIDGIATLKLDLVATTTLAALLLMLGYFLKRKIDFLEKFCFPVPVIGGFVFAIFIWIFRITGTFHISLDTTLQTPFMLAFFTTVGLGGSLALIKLGGKSLIIYLVFCWFLAVFQNTLGVGLAKMLDIHPVLGVMAGSVSLEGGHGAAATFGPEAEKLGVMGATAVAIASATFGLIAGNLTGGPLARKLITKYNVEIKTADTGMGDYEALVSEAQAKETITAKGFLFMMAVIGVMMVFGVWLSGWVKTLGIPNFFLPGYVGAMFGAIILRNINDKTHTFVLNSRIIDLMSDVSIGMFLSMAMMNLKIWELADLAIPLIIILVVQVACLVALVYFVLFRLLGKDYDAAVMCAGAMGHGLGATPNAVANMGAVSEHFGLRSNKAFLIVPLCGAVLIDLVGIPCIVFFIGAFAG
ncbi:sodium/glutamate symporter [Deltaproteobacteria bacterium Smac51]|nr:sodium/glutamate symporter [Deltaproteobacteria bacterium Smac51]